MKTIDVIVVGAGIAGTSAAYELAKDYSVLLLEMESQPGYHSTGRSAALYTEAYGNSVIRSLTTNSRSFLESPPEGFCDYDILTPRPTLFIGREDQIPVVEKELHDILAIGGNVKKVVGDDLLQLHPMLRPNYAAMGLLEPDSSDIDVNALHLGFLRLLKQAGGMIETDAGVERLEAIKDGWLVKTEKETFQCRWVVNAAGAWADKVGQLAGAQKIGLIPKRRTVFTFDPPEGSQVDQWPMIFDIDEEFYFKPDSGKLLGSPCDVTPVEPQDARPEDIDIAIGVDRIQNASRMAIRKISHKWAGLRSFVADRSPVVGFDSIQPNFFWLAGQGGYGIMTSPAMARCCATLIQSGDLPEGLKAQGVQKEQLSPARL